MENIQGFDFSRLHFDADGKLQHPQELEDLKGRAAGATDAIFIAHGFRNDEDDASRLFTGFLQTLRQHIDGSFQASLGARRFVVAGVYWPSKAFSEDVKFEGATASIDDESAEKRQMREKLIELRDSDACVEQKPRIDKAIKLLDDLKGNPEAQDEFVEHVLSLLDDSKLDPAEGLENVRAKSGSELLDLLSTPLRNPVPVEEDGEGGVASLGDVFVADEDGGAQSFGSFFGSVFSRVNQFLNLTTWYLMKDRCGVVGESGMAEAVRAVKNSAPAIKIHLVGHSLGGRLMAGCLKTLAQAPKLRPESATLLEAAFSHFGFSAGNGKGQVGYFRSVIDENVVNGPFLATFSEQDSVVGTAYAIASRLAGDNLKAIGDKNDPFGGIGRNGAQKTAEALAEKLHLSGAPYNFTTGKILCLDGSGGLIKDHGDVTNSNVTYAFASAVAAT